jgi:hypothetical protein
MIISYFKLFKENKLYSFFKLLFKLIIYFNLFMLSIDFILRYESDEIYTILINIYNNIKIISYNTIKDIIYFIK